jgi:glutaredoxin
MTRQPRFIIFSGLFLLIFSLALVSSASSQVYKWTDGNGNICFSDSPPAGVKAQKIQAVSRSPKTEANPALPGAAPKAEKGEVKVILYMTAWCPYCRLAREYLQTLNVNLVEYDVEKNREKAAEFKAKGGNGVPLIDVEGTVIKGYNQESLKSAVEEKRRR